MKTPSSRLTATKVETAKPTGKRKEIPDGGSRGLYLIVQPSGAKSWAVRYWFEDKKHKITLGQYPELSLDEARNEARVLRGKLAKGIDPGIVEPTFNPDEAMKTIAAGTGGKVSVVLSGIGFVAAAFRDPHDPDITREAVADLQRQKRGSVLLLELPERITAIQERALANGTGSTMEEALRNLALALHRAGK